MDISVIILSWNDKAYLDECLESLKAVSSSRKMEIIVVDNASVDGGPEMVESKFPYVKLIRNRGNLGFPRGNNVGVQASTGNYVCLLNSDIKVLAGCLEVLMDFMDANEDVGLVGPRILNRDMSHQSSCRRFPTLWNNFCSATGLATAFPKMRVFSGEHMFYFLGDRLLDVEVLVGCFWMARRRAISDFGLLDEGFFMYAEDVDWCRRCWASGWRVVFHPGAQAIHYRGGSSIKKDPVWLALTQQRSVLRYWRKYHGKSGVFGMSCLIFCHKAIRWGAACLRYATGLGERNESEVRMRVAVACIRALFADRLTESA